MEILNHTVLKSAKYNAFHVNTQLLLDGCNVTVISYLLETDSFLQFTRIEDKIKCFFNSSKKIEIDDTKKSSIAGALILKRGDIVLEVYSPYTYTEDFLEVLYKHSRK